MQTKKKSSGRGAARDHAGIKVSRAQKKISENAQVVEKKVADLITSSTRKQRLGRLMHWFMQVRENLLVFIFWFITVFSFFLSFDQY